MGKKPEEYENTLIRANAVVSRLEGEKTVDIEKRTECKRSSIIKWVSIVNGNDGINKLLKLNNKSVNNKTRDTSKDEELLLSVKNDIKDLKKQKKDDGSLDFPNTLKRLRAIRSYLNDKERSLQKQPIIWLLV